MIWVIIAIVFVFVGIIAGIIGFLVMRKNQIKQKNTPVESVQVTVGGTHTETKMTNKNFTSSTVDSFNAYEQKGYYVQFRTKNNKKLSFRVNKKEWLSYHDGDQGILTYQGYKIIRFEPKKATSKYNGYFDSSVQGKNTCWLYGEAIGLQVYVPSTKPVICNHQDIELFLKDLMDDESDWFFTIKNSLKEEIQIEREGKNMVKQTNLADEQSITYSKRELLEYIKSFMKRV